MTGTPPDGPNDHLTPHNCADYYCAARLENGEIRLNGGHGLLVANADHTAADVWDWFRMSQPGQYREQYRAVLRFLGREALGGPGDPIVHPDEVTPNVEDQPTPVEDTATCLVCGCSRNEPFEQRLRDLVREQRRQLDARDRQVDRLLAEKAEVPA